MAASPVRLDEHIKDILIDAVERSDTQWAIVRDGAVAEFSLGSSKGEVKMAMDKISVSTDHGSMSLDMADGLYAIVAECAEYRCTPWTECIYLCMYKDEAMMNSRGVLTCVGEYDDGSIIWDIGIGDDSLDVYIIVRDDDLNCTLKEMEGKNILDKHSILNTIVKTSPYRLFISKKASILVKQRIGILDGAHTHLMPDVILAGRRYPTPVPEHMRCIIQVDPFSSLIDCHGNYHAWSIEDDPFQMLLKRYSKDYTEEKYMHRDKMLRLLGSKGIDDVEHVYKHTKNNKDILRVILAQIACDSRLEPSIRMSSVKALARVSSGLMERTSQA